MKFGVCVMWFFIFQKLDCNGKNDQENLSNSIQIIFNLLWNWNLAFKKQAKIQIHCSKIWKEFGKNVSWHNCQLIQWHDEKLKSLRIPFSSGKPKLGIFFQLLKIEVQPIAHHLDLMAISSNSLTSMFLVVTLKEPDVVGSYCLIWVTNILGPLKLWS